MHETDEQLAALQLLLDESYAHAGAHLRSIITPERRLSAEQVVATLKGMCLLNLATVTAGCAPVVGPVDGVFYQGKFWFGSAQSSVRFRHIRARPQVSAAHTRGEELVVTVHGTARVIDVTTGEYDGLKDIYREVYGPEWDSWGYWGNAPYAWIEPRRMFAAAFKPLS
jgi:nitroimidazol reductase NimA-like FMN-containing flavoprotein (pyridoxamine 5'-phosphate oxidase superfamily)